MATDRSTAGGAEGRCGGQVAAHWLAAAIVVAVWPTPALAQSNPRTVDEARAARQDPMSALRSVYLQNIYGNGGAGAANSFSIQPVWPFRLGEDWRMVTYTIIPVDSLPGASPGQDRSTGLGNILFNGYIRPNSQGPISWGIGPAVQLPTRSNRNLGSGTVSAGPAALIYVPGATFSAGAVVQNIWSMGGSGADRVNEFSAQYILNYNLPDGWFLYSNATITADWLAPARDRWLVPVGGGLGRVFQINDGGWFYSAGVQGFYNAERPRGAPTWEAIAQFQVIISLPN